jgi:hypothetical protein
MRREYDFSKGIRGKHAGKRFRIVGDPRAEQSLSTNKADIYSRLLEAKEITVSWLYEGTEGFIYKSVPGSIVANPQTQSLRFELTEKNGDDDNFEVIIRSTNGAFSLKADHPEMKNREYTLKGYLGSDELVFYLHDDNNRAYFHLHP